MRIHHYESVTLALLANAYEGFSACLPEASIVLLDIFEYAFRQSTGSMQTRLRDALEVARERFDALEYKDTFEEGKMTPPLGSLLAVAITGKTALAMWLGNKVVFHVRGFEVTRTTPHTLREHYRAKDPSAPVDHLPINMLSGGIDRDAPALAPSFETFHLLPGDSLVLAHHAHHVAEEVAYAAACFLSPQRAADCLAGLALGEKQFFTTAMVLRFDDFDFAREIDRLIDAYEAPANAPALSSWSRKHQALPVLLDMGAFLALTRDGNVLSDAWEAPFAVREDASPHNQLLCAIEASKKFPTLASLAPRKGPSAQPCTKHMPSHCPHCMNLGWLPPKRPERMKQVAADAPTSEPRRQRWWWPWQWPFQ